MEQLISSYIDHELSPAETEMVKSHLAVCANCGREHMAMLQLSAACKDLSEMVRTAPPGFKDAVMLRIEAGEEAGADRYAPAGPVPWYNRPWKQAVAGAAALILLTAGAVTFNMNYAKHQVAGVAPPNGQTKVTGTVDNPNTGTPSNTGPKTGITTTKPDELSDPGGSTNGTASPLVSTPTSGQVLSGLVFLNKDRYIETTMLEVKVEDSAVALEKALSLTANAQVQNLGSQFNASGTCTVLKITVPRSAATGLLTGLSSLGTVVNQNVNKEDLTTRYTEALIQYQSLITQRATLQPNTAQLAELDQRIETLERNLQNWDNESAQEIIVLQIIKETVKPAPGGN